MEDRKTHYGKKGMYNSYDKKHKERDALDYYSTPTEEAINILNHIKLDLSSKIVLDPCVGGGHLIEGIKQWGDENNLNIGLCATDIKNRGFNESYLNSVQYDLDYLADDYTDKFGFEPDYIIMNPPYSTIEPFVMKSLGLANKGVLMLARLQFLEGQSRYENILKDYPPSDIWVYVDRIKCYKNGDPSIPVGAVQAYAWYYWNLESEKQETKVHWIRRANKNQ